MESVPVILRVDPTDPGVIFATEAEMQVIGVGISHHHPKNME
jgi:hypothetical protein